MTVQEMAIVYSRELAYLSAIMPGVTIDANVAAAQINKAYHVIRNYLFLDEDAFLYTYADAACELASVYLNNEIVKAQMIDNNRPVTQITEGSRSVTFATSIIPVDSRGLTETVKAMLPLPLMHIL